jgi:uncharacterized delta-60 repeat protein
MNFAPRVWSRSTLLSILLAFFTINASAQTGTPDLAFNTADAGLYSGNGAGATVSVLAYQPDGKLLAGGLLTQYNSTTTGALIRLGTNGLLDPTFNVGGSGANGVVLAIALQTDGKIIIGGSFTSYNGTSVGRIARINSDGTLDADFNIGGVGANGPVYALAVLPSGRILVGGSFTTFNGANGRYLIQLVSNGSRDATFNAAGAGGNATVRALAVQSDGKIMIGGDFTSFNASTVGRLARLSSAGAVDATFNPGGTGASGTVYGLLVQPDGKYVVCGSFSSYNNNNSVARIMRLSITGAYDSGFNTNSSGVTPVYTVTRLSDGKIIASGPFTSYNFTTKNYLVRLTTIGSVDATFNTGAGPGSSINAVAVAPDNKIAIAGDFATYDGTVAEKITRLSALGAIDPTFNAQTGANNEVQGVGVQSTNKVIVGGFFTRLNGTSKSYFARLLVDGTIDASFNTGGAGFNTFVTAVAVQPNDQVIVSGGFNSYNGTTKANLARLNSDGSLDANFNSGGAGPNSSASKIVVRSDGKILIGGSFTTFNGSSYPRIIRLNADGSPDATFNNLGTGPSGAVFGLAALPDGRTIITGQLVSVAGTTVNYIARLNVDGSLDNTFNSGGSGFDNTTETVVIQADGKLVIGGLFTTFNGISCNRIVRLNADGSYDATFNAGGSGADKEIRSIVQLPNGKLLLGGQLTNYNGVGSRLLTRITSEGLPDATFNAGGVGGTGASSFVHHIAVGPDGSIVIVGAFSAYNGVGHNRFARILGDPQVRTGTVASPVCVGASITVPFTVTGIANTGNVFTAQLSDAAGSFAAPTAIGTVTGTGSGSINATIPSTPGSGYRIRVTGSLPEVTGTDNGSDITINGLASATFSYPGSPYCSSTGIVPVFFSGTAGGSFSSTAGLSVDVNSGAINLAASTSGIYTVSYTIASSCGGSATASVSIRPSVGISAAANQVICAGQSVAAVSFAGAVNYSWTNNNASIGLAASGTGDIPAFIAINNGVVPVTANIAVSASTGTGCSIKTMSFRITVKPVPPAVSNIPTQFICAGNMTHATSFSPVVSGTVFSWTNDNASLGFGATGTGNIPSFVALNNTGSIQSANLTVRPVAAGCIGDPAIFSFLTVTPSVVAVFYASAAYCQSGTASPTRTGSTGGTWSASPVGLSINAATGALNLASSTPGIYTVSYSIAPVGGCSNSASTQVTINAQAIVNPSPNPVYCNGMATSPIVFTGTAASYNWTNDNPTIGIGASGTGNIPSFTTFNGGPTAQYATIRVSPQGNGSSTCPGKATSFRMTINYCGPVTHAGDYSGHDATGRMGMQVTVGPNPARHMIRIAYTGNAQRLLVEIRDAFGRPATGAQVFNGDTKDINIEALRPGSYFVVITDAVSGTQVSKGFVKL